MRIATTGRVAAALALMLAAPTAGAQLGSIVSIPHIAVGGVGSTLGLGGDVAVGFGRFVVLRGARTVGSIGANRSVQDQAYNMFAKADNRSLMLDLHVFGGGIYVSAGKVDNRSTIALTGSPASNGTYTFNGTSYSADSVGVLSGALVLPAKPLFFGLGWDHTFGNSWPASVVSRFGVLHQDPVKIALAASGPYGQASNPAHAQFQAALDAERTKQETSLDRSNVRNLPVVELGMRVRLF